MEGNKPIIFDDGLREAFEHPLKKYPTLQKVLLTDSENENEEDAFISKIIIPLCSVMYYLINKDAAVFEYFVKFIDDLGELKSIPRLDSNEIFETLSQLSIRNAMLVLERYYFTDGTYTELKGSLEEGDKRRFVTTLKDCNTTPISPILKFLNIPHLVNQKFAALELEATKADFESNELFSKWALYKVRKLLQELFGNRIKTNGPNTIRLELPEGVEAIMQFEEEEDECVDTELVLFCYDLFFGLFSCINGEGVLDENEINVIEYILKQYPFENWYEQHQDYWKNGGTDGEFLSFITRHKDYFSNELVNEINSSFKDNDSFEEAEVIEEPQSTPQIKEPQTSKSPAEIEAQKEADKKKKEAKAFNLIKELLTNTAGEKDFFKPGFTLDQLIMFFEKILTEESVLDVLTKTDNRMKYVYKGIVLEKFCNIIGYLIDKGVISESQKDVAEVLFGMEETKTAILNWKPVKTSQEAFDREQNLFKTLSSYISNGFNNTSKSFIVPKIRGCFDETLDSVRKSQ